MNSVNQYQKKLRKQLPCKNTVKTRLLENFQASLDEFLEDHPSPTMEDLNVAFGPPEEMAKILTQQITQKEADTYRKTRKIKKVLSAILAAAFLLFVLYVFFYKEKPLTSEEVTTIIGEVTTPETTVGG